MPITLDSTVSGPDANTYADLDYYKGYLSTRRPLPVWLALALSGDLDEELKIDLIQAGRVLDTLFSWKGVVSDPDQHMMFPRSGLLNRKGVSVPTNVNPNEIKDAQCEYAVILHDKDLLSANDAEDKGVKKVKAGSVEVEFQTRDITGLESADTAITRQGPEFDYLKVPQSVRMFIPESWYERATLISRQFVFQPVG